MISSDISEKFLGDSVPDLLAEVDTSGLRNLLSKCLQKSSLTTRMAIVPSSLTRLSASPVRLHK
jgi:hypothetical protein